MNQIHVGQILDVAAVERELRGLWQDSAAEQENEESVVMRARVANLIVLIPDQSSLEELNQTLKDLSALHPNRTIVNVAARKETDRDIELYVSSFYQTDGRGGKRLSCELIILIARGRFVPELPSAALPLLIPDLPTFLWWCDALEFDDRTFLDFSRAADRLVIDSVDAKKSHSMILALARLFEEGRQEQLGISDINWARLTSWRALLASFYDAPRCKGPLARIDSVVVGYSAPEHERDEIAPQALLLTGWLGSRLGWEVSSQPPQKSSGRIKFAAQIDNRLIDIELNRIERAGIRPGRLARMQLNSDDGAATFVVSRHEQGLHLETQVTIHGQSHPGRILPVRNRSTAQLLGREIEILSNDNIYAEAVKWAAKVILNIDTGPAPSV
ncbi:MAG TPA: glucose-6-phosphate dehydrogenase assembly protein OpcA [Pyrinomonadaceae bacterium]|nr:glucose-6-phosphate dehydrogenase assembly protein OpcA [Pyrinomonadaceae bacterium]